MTQRGILILVLILGLGAAGAAYYYWSSFPGSPGNGSGRTEADQASDQTSADRSNASGYAQNRSSRAPYDLSAKTYAKPAGSSGTTSGAGGPSKTATGVSESSAVQGLFGIGPVQAVPGNANPQVASVLEAARSGQHPERLSPWIIPKSFDAAAYRQNPKAYLDVVEPGRVYGTAEPSKTVPVLKPSGGQFFRLEQKQTTTLAVRSVPAKAPVTFTSFDLGAFENGLTSITVAADDQGVAQVKFTAIPGTVADVNILAGSPLASGQVKFTVYVEPPAVASTPNGG